MKYILPVSILAVMLIALLFYEQQSSERLVVSGTIEADDVRVGSRVGGRIAEVYVEEGQDIATGDRLIVIQPFDLNERKAQAQQKLEAAEARYQKFSNGFRNEEIQQSSALRDEAAAVLEEFRNGPRSQEVAAAEAQLRLALAELKKASRNYARIESLFGDGVVTQSELDDANTQLSVASATAEDRREKLDLLKAGTRKEVIAQAEARLRKEEQNFALRKSGYRIEEIEESRAQRDEAKAALALIERQLKELTVSAPFDGVVEAVDLRPGDIVPANAPIITLLDTKRLYVRAYLPESWLNVSIGDEVEFTVNSIPDKRFTGDITFVARQSEFTPGNIQTPEERSKQVFRIRVEVTSGLDQLRPGMYADVHLKSRPRK